MLSLKCAFRSVNRSFATIRALQLPTEPHEFAKYGGRFVVTALPGDGIGPEMIACVDKIFKFANIPIDFEYMDVSSNDPGNDSLLNAITSIKRNGLAIKVCSRCLTYLTEYL
jgi:isocitrate dehydrogenase (NAD+)